MISHSKVCNDFKIKNNVLIGSKLKVKNCVKHIGQIIEENLGKNPNDVGQIDVDSGEHTTNSQIQDQSVRVALWLRKQGIGKNDIVALSTDNHLRACIPIISSLFIGAAFNPWPAELTIRTACYMMQMIQPEIMFSIKKNVEILREAAKLENVKLKIVVFEEHPSLPSIDDIMNSWTIEEVETFEVVDDIDVESDIAMIIFSSGTSGFPKGIMHSYKTLNNYTKASEPLVANNTRYLWYSLLYWMSGTSRTLSTILKNQTRILHNAFDPEKTCKIIEEFKVNLLFLSPSDLIKLQKSNILRQYRLESLGTLGSIGSKISKNVIEDIKQSLPHVTLYYGYGLSEIATTCAMHTEYSMDVNSIGTVYQNSEIRIFDQISGKNLGPNQEGELLVKSLNVMLGYYKNPTATKELIDNDGWVHTGDMGYYNETGEIFITDRKKEIMKFRGHHVTPSEIEALLIAHPEVLRVAVVPVPHEIDIERPMAFVQKVQNSSKLTADDLIKISEVLGPHKRLWGGVKFLEEFPVTPSGKNNRKELKEMAKLLAKNRE